VPNRSSDRRTVLLAGITRSGSTWISRALGLCERTTLVHEPDNERLHAEALAAKARLGRHPVLDGDDEATGYEQLFTAALAGASERGAWRRRLADRIVARSDPAMVEEAMGEDGRWPLPLTVARHLTRIPMPAPADGARVVKSVHCAFALEWLARRTEPDAVAVTVRHPGNVIGSWQSMGWKLERFPWTDPRVWRRFGPPGSSPPQPSPPEPFIERAAWHFALVANALVGAAERNGWPVVDHQQVVEDPVTRLADLAARLGLTWTDEATAWIESTDQPGTGYDLHRVRSEEVDRWRTRLTDAERDAVRSIVSRFPRLEDRWSWDSPATTAHEPSP
jgi:hypothetical protein